MMNTLRSITLLAVLVVLGGFITTAALIATSANFASSWSVNNNADWTPFPPSANPLGPADNNCTGASTPTGSWAEFTFPAYSIPGGDVLQGIEVRVNYRSSATNTAQLTKSGSLVGSTRTVPMAFVGPSGCSSTFWVSAGGASDLWGAGLTVADFNAGIVGFRLTQNANTIDLDAVEIIVHHGPANSNPNCSGAAIADQNANASCQATISGSDVTGVTDPDGDVLTIMVSPTTLSLGANSVMVSADDGNGGTCNKTINVNVVDNTNPVITCPANATLNANATCEATYSGSSATATDNCDASPAISSVPSVPALFSGVGANTITYTADDGNGNTAMCDQTVTVEDNTPPVITLNGANPLTLECNQQTYNEPGATAVDNCDGSVPATPSGTVDESTPGTYEIDYTATDAAGNSAEETRTVEIEDTTPPVVTLNGSAMVTLECGIETYTELGATAFDICDGALPNPTPVGTVDESTPGTYEIDYTATDGAGLSDTATRTVNVVDTTPPEIILAAGPIELWPPNHKYHSFAVDGLVTEVVEACADLDVDDVVIASTSSDEEENATGGGDGNTTDDIVIQTGPPLDCSSVDLRAERQGGSDGRVYMINLEVTDGPNMDAETFEVHVPHSKKSGAVGGPGLGYAVTGCPIVPRVVSTEELESTAQVEQLKEATGETPAVEPKTEAGPTESLDVAAEGTPEAFMLHGNRPNPFNPQTTIRFDVAESAYVKLVVYDMLGRQVRVLVDGTREAGTHEVTFEAGTLPSGTYLYRLDTPLGSFTGSMLLLK